MTGTGKQSVTVSTPGRVCLFGEHLDYLGLPVIPAAISLRIRIAAERRADRRILLDLPDVGRRVEFSLDDPIVYENERDYFRSAVRVLLRAGFEFPHGLEGRVHGDIPINAGTSSSTALVVSWVNLLARMSRQEKVIAPKELALYAHAAEVVEFREPGGKMDHFSTALGGICHLEVDPTFSLERLTPRLGTFVLGDSGEPKDTRHVLSRVKNRVLAIAAELITADRGFSLHTMSAKDALGSVNSLTEDDRRLLHGTLRNREITDEGLAVLSSDRVDERKFGALLLEHQSILRDVLGISTPKIDRMLEAACSAGALGGKINGSGGGGCMFAYAPERPDAVAEAIARAGGRPHIVTIDEGSRGEE